MKRLLLWMTLLPGTAFCQQGFQEKIDREAAALKCPPPDQTSPVTVNAAVVVEADSVAVIVKTELLAGWHIYAYVPENQPYIQLDPILKTPPTLRPVGALAKSVPIASLNDPGVLIYEDRAVFVQKYARQDRQGGKITAGLYFQCCDIKQCLPPDERTVTLQF